jgi:Ca2+-binding RTX toxin-like protein
VQADLPDLYSDITQNGMLNVRYQRPLDATGPSTDISNHSWGIAVDLKIGGQVDTTQGKVFDGIAALIPYFNAAGWVSGAAWTQNQDNMHFEVSKDLLLQWYGPTINSVVLNSDGTATISGHARPDIPVSVLDGTTALVSVNSNMTDGSWTYTTAKLTNSIHKFQVTEKDASAPSDVAPIASSGVAILGTTRTDHLVGGKGDDLLVGESGSNILTGNAGADHFVFGNAATGHNTITDFQLNVDHVQLVDGVSVAGLVDNPSGTTLQLSTGGQVELAGISHLVDWHVLL